MPGDACDPIVELALSEIFSGVTAVEALSLGGAGAVIGAAAALLIAWLACRPRQLSLFD